MRLNVRLKGKAFITVQHQSYDTRAEFYSCSNSCAFCARAHVYFTVKLITVCVHAKLYVRRDILDYDWRSCFGKALAILEDACCVLAYMRFTQCKTKCPSSRPFNVTCCFVDLLAKCKNVTDQNLAAAVNNVNRTMKACPCGLKYKELTDIIAEQTMSTGTSNTCAPVMQKIIKGAVCPCRNTICGRTLLTA